MMSKLNVVIRDPKYPCKTYAASGHSFWVVVLTCDYSLVAIQALTEAGPGGGKVYGEIEVPPGQYILFGLSPHGNVMTQWASITAGCGQDVCVSLMAARMEQCLWGLLQAIQAALSGREGKEDKGKRVALENARGALEELRAKLPDYEPPLTAEDLAKAKAPEELVALWKELQERTK